MLKERYADLFCLENAAKEHAALTGFTYVKERTEKAANGEMKSIFHLQEWLQLFYKAQL